jgi:LysR family transcriptional regulator (chromosome initiation inhibitor)
LLEHALQSDLGGRQRADRSPTARVAINADSLATWFVEAMAGAEGWLFDLVVDDQDHSTDWLRRGDVSAAVSSNAGPVQGCDSTAIGALRYVATATPDFVDRWFPHGPDPASLAHAPTITFNPKDTLQTNWVRELVGHTVAMPTHWMPSSQAFIDATLASVGWGMNPESLVADHLSTGRLVVLAPGRPLDVALYWQISRLMAPALATVTAAVKRSADQNLISPKRL